MAVARVVWLEKKRRHVRKAGSAGRKAEPSLVGWIEKAYESVGYHSNWETNRHLRHFGEHVTGCLMRDVALSPPLHCPHCLHTSESVLRKVHSAKQCSFRNKRRR